MNKNTDTHLLSLGVVIPCFNESETIVELLTKVTMQNCVREVVVIDDASTDDSYKKILEFSNSRIKVIQQPKNMGKALLSKGDFLK